jgi:hypothetical protein
MRTPLFLKRARAWITARVRAYQAGVLRQEILLQMVALEEIRANPTKLDADGTMTHILRRQILRAEVRLARVSPDAASALQAELRGLGAGQSVLTILHPQRAT